MGETALVAFQLRNSELVPELRRAWDEGKAVLPIDPNLPRPAVEAILDTLRPSSLITGAGSHSLGGAPISDEIAAVMMTSGASGKPKGVELSHRALQSSAQAVTAVLGTSRRWLCCLPLSHIAGLSILMRSQVAGTEPVVHDGFDIGAIAAEQSTGLISLVPTALQRLLDAGVDLTGYSNVLLGGARLPQTLLRRAEESGLDVITTYGMTETCGGCVHDGFPLPGVEITSEDDRLLIRGPVLLDGYRLQPELTASALRDGWFHTSDSGTIGSDGRITVFGRIDDLINTGGLKVSPEEVESILCEHPLVSDAAVAGIPDDQWGQAIAAMIVASGAEPTLQELKAFVASRGGSFKAPKRIRVVKEIPRNAAGKIQRGQVALGLE